MSHSLNFLSALKRPAFIASIFLCLAAVVLSASGGLFEGRAAPRQIDAGPMKFGKAEALPEPAPNKEKAKHIPYVGAVNGIAFILIEHLNGIEKIEIETKMPVFRAYGITPDRSRLLYSPLKNGRPSGLLYLEDLASGQQIKVTSRIVLSASMSPGDPSQIVYTFADHNGFSLGLANIEQKSDRTLISGNVFAETLRWSDDGRRIHFFSTVTGGTRLKLNSPYRLESPFSSTDEWDEWKEESTIDLVRPDLEEKGLNLIPQSVAVGDSDDGNAKNFDPQGLPKLLGVSHVPLEFLPVPGGRSAKGGAPRAFQTCSEDGIHCVTGDDLVGFGKLVAKDTASGREIEFGNAVLTEVLRNGVVIRDFQPEGTVTKYVDWDGNQTILGLTTVDYRLPMANAKMTQGGAAYSSPGSCDLSAHYETMGYAYDFQNLTVGAHALAVADGLVVFTHQSMACNQIQQSCPDYSPTGCPGFYLGNQVIIQHADGTYSAFSHLETNSIQVAVGTDACQGLYVGRQGHTGSVSGAFNSCGDHLHVQRQVSPDPSGQSIPLTFSDAASNPLSCGSTYSTSSTEIVHSIANNSQNFPVGGGNGSVNVSSNGCSWNAISNVSWITVNSFTGSGNGTVSYTVADNSTSGVRSGTMVIGGHAFTVTQAGGGVTNQAPVVDAGPDQSVNIAAGAQLAGSVADDGLPLPALTSTWTQVSGPGVSSFANADNPNTLANFTQAGIYTLRLTASDGELTSSNDVRIIVNVTGAGGSLIGSQDAPLSTANLTAEGTADWAHWGYSDSTSFNHKAAVIPQIGNFTRIGTVSTLRSSSNGSPQVTFGWNDGTPTGGQVNTPSCVYTYGEGNGFELTVPADTNLRTLRLYVGVWRVRGRIEAELSDGSSSPFVDNSLSTVYPAGAANGVYTIAYTAASPGQHLRVRWIIDSSTYPVGNVALQAATLTVSAPPANQPPTVNAGSDQAVTLAGGVSLSGTAADDGLPNPPSLLTTAWSKVSGPGTVAFGSAGSLVTTANFSSAGVYVLRLTGSDGALSSSDDITVTVNASGSSGSLAASSAATPANVNLSTEGTADWAHWGLSSASSFTRRSGAAQQISNFTNLGGGVVERYADNPTAYSWTGGTPAGSASNTQAAVFVIGQNNGFRITVPADTTQRTLKLYVGVWSARGRLSASLSDSSAPAYSDTSVVNSSDTANRVYTINYKAAASGQTLTVSWTVDATFNAWSNVTLQGATLVGAPPAPTPTPTPTPTPNLPPVVNAGSNQAITLPGNVSLSGTATDDGQPNPPAILTTAWSKVSGPGTVTFGNANALVTTASFSAAGVYVLRLTGDDGGLTASDDVVITVSPEGSAGSLLASSSAPPANVNLSTEGTSDWAHWGLSSASSFTRKSGASQQISNYTPIGSAGTFQLTGNPTRYSWTGGTPIGSASNTDTGLWVVGQNNGYQITVPADTTLKTLKLYVGVWAGRGRLEASLSDSSAPVYVDTSIVNTTETANRVYTLSYKSSTAGQTLTVKWTLESANHGWANVTLQAASLAGGTAPSPTPTPTPTPTPNTPPQVDAGSNQLITLPGTANLGALWVIDDGLPNPPSSVATTWSKVSGPGTVTFGSPNAMSTTASFSQAGSYVLMLSAFDGELTGTDIMIVTVHPPGAGELQAYSFPPPANTSYDLSAEGTADWAHWGLGSASSVNRKSGTIQQIGNFTLLGTGTSQQYGGNTTFYSWTNGAPTVTSAATSAGVRVQGLNNGYQVTAPADTTVRSLKVYVGLAFARGRFEASLSDGSGPVYIDTTQVDPDGAWDRVYVLNYKAGSSGQTMTVKWTMEESYSAASLVSLHAATLVGNIVQPANQPPTVNAGSDQAVTLAGGVSLSGTAADDGLPNPPSLLTTAWSKVSGPGTVAFGSAGSLVTTANFSSAGVYVLRLTGSDGALSSSDDITVTVNASGSSGSLAASSAATPANVNLSTEGTADWAHWGLSSASSFTRRSGAAQQISNVTNLGGGVVERYADNPTAYSWTGGTPAGSASNTQAAVFVIGQNNGFRITVPADTTQRTLKLYVGVWSARGRLSASLSDSSAPAYSDTSVVNSSDTANRVYTINYKAAASGQTLTVSWTVDATFNAWSNVTLQGATLTAGGAPLVSSANTFFPLAGPSAPALLAASNNKTFARISEIVGLSPWRSN